MEKRYIHKQGHIVWVILTGSAVPDASGMVMYAIAQIQDITAKKNAEAALRQEQEELHNLAGRLIKVQEEERKRIARALHDDLSQRLAMFCVALDLLRQSLPASFCNDFSRQHGIAAKIVHEGDLRKFLRWWESLYFEYYRKQWAT